MFFYATTEGKENISWIKYNLLSDQTNKDYNHGCFSTLMQLKKGRKPYIALPMLEPALHPFPASLNGMCVCIHYVCVCIVYLCTVCISFTYKTLWVCLKKPIHSERCHWSFFKKLNLKSNKKVTSMNNNNKKTGIVWSFPSKEAEQNSERFSLPAALRLHSQQLIQI